MARIYEGGEAQNRYQGVDKSVRYSPVQATNSNAQVQGYKAEQMERAQTIGRELSRAQEAENLALRAQQSAEQGQQKLTQLGETFDLKRDITHETFSLEKDHLHEELQMQLDASELKARNSVESARLKVIGSSIQSLLDFGGSVIQYGQKMDQIRQQEQAEAEQLALENAELEAAGLGSTFGEAEPISEEEIGIDNNSDTLMQSETTAVNNVTEPMIASGDIAEENMAVRLRQSTTWKSLEPLRSKGYAAAGMYPAAIQQAKAEGLIRPGAQGYLDAQRFTREFAKMTGVMGAPRKLQLKFARIAAAANSNMVQAATAEDTKATIEGNKQSWANNTSSIVDGSLPGEIGAAFDQVHAETLNGNIGFNGKQSRAATTASLSEVLKNLIDEGRTGDIKDLRNHQYNQSTGRTLGQDFDALFDAAEQEAAKKAITNFNTNANTQMLGIKEAEQLFNSNPTPETRRAAIDKLLEIGTIEAISKANSLAEKGLNYDSAKALELDLRAQDGNPATQSEIQELAKQGIISPSEAKARLKDNKQIQAEKTVDAYTKSLSSGLRQAMMGKNSPSDLSAKTKGELTIRHKALMAELNDRINAEVLGRPELANKPEELAKLAEHHSQWLLNQPRYKLEQNAKTGAVFGGGLETDRRLNKITNKAQNQDFSQFTAEEMFTQLKFPKSAMQPDKDTFLTMDQLKADSQALIDGGKVSKRTNDIAHALGYSGRTFVESQLRLQGLPTLGEMKSSAGTPPPAPSSQSTNPVRDRQTELQSLGMPTNNASWMAENSQQSGGALKLQVQAMKTTSPQTYAVFMNPKSTPSQLRKASVNYFGANAKTPGGDPVRTPNTNLSNIERKALDALAKYESSTSGDYNAVNQIGLAGGHSTGRHLGAYSGDIRKMGQHGGRSLTDMTIGEIMDLQARRPGMSNSQWIKQGRLHAVGRYQFIGPTFARTVQALGLDRNTKYSPAVQDKMGLWLLRNGGGGINQWVGPRTYASQAERAVIQQARYSR